MGLRVELVQPPWLIPGHPRQRQLVQHGSEGLRACGHLVKYSRLPTYSTDWIVMWGLGHPQAQEVLQVARKRRVIVVGFDLGYWNRTEPNMSFRVSVDSAHPDGRVMAKVRPTSRIRDDGIRLRDDADPRGPIVLVGMGYKSAETYGESPGQWEDRALAKIREAWPGREVLFRPKPGGGNHRPQGVKLAEGQAIEEVLRGAAAVYCRQSNVAVDAIIAGVPAVAEEGAASEICDKELQPGRLPRLPPVPVREEFLANLAWFQWKVSELRRPATWTAIEDIVRT